MSPTSTKVFDALVKELTTLGASGDVPAKVIAISGTTSGTGFIAAKECAKLGATVLLLNRPSERATKSLEQLKKEVPEGNFEAVECDLASFSSVDAAAETIKSKHDSLYCLANNAGVMALEDVATEDGYDIQMQVNAISPFRLTRQLFPLLEAGAEKWGEARIVMHTSIARFGSPLKQKYLEKNGGNLGGNGSSMMFNGARWERYHQTKLADIVMFAALADRLAQANSKVKALVAHPGVSATNLQTTTSKDGGMGWLMLKITTWMSQSPEDGASGLLKCMAYPSLNNKEFYGPKGGKAALKGEPVLLPSEKLWDNEETKSMFWKSCEDICGEFKIPSASTTSASESTTSNVAST